MHVFSGLLTGKYKRDETPTASLGRIGAVAENEEQALAVAPAWSKLGEFYWKLREGLEQIGKEQGRALYAIRLYNILGMFSLNDKYI